MYIRQKTKGIIIHFYFCHSKLNIYIAYYFNLCFFNERIIMKTRNILKIINMSRYYCLKHMNSSFLASG